MPRNARTRASQAAPRSEEPEEQPQLEIEDQDMESTTTNDDNPPRFPSVEDMERELANFESRRRRARLMADLAKAQADGEAGFPQTSSSAGTLTLPVWTKDEDAMAIEKLYHMKNPVVYKGENQKDLDRFLRECNRAFQIKSITYRSDTQRVNYAQSYLEVRSSSWQYPKEKGP